MNGMAGFIAERIRIESNSDVLTSMSSENRAAAIGQIKEEAEARSAFKKHQLVRVCRSPGFSLTTGSFPHDHNDPKQHFDSRVMGWDCFGRIQVATVIHDNPHCSEWCWKEDMVHHREGEDWANSSSFQIGQEISFKWELLPWRDQYQGRIVPAILQGPHIEIGDWLVLYEKLCGMWITRVLNEGYMGPR